MSNKGPLKLKVFLRRLKDYDIYHLPLKRGKGSEIILTSDKRLKNGKPIFHTIKNHGKKTLIYRQVIQTVCRKFSIDEDEFYGLK